MQAAEARSIYLAAPADAMLHAASPASTYITSYISSSAPARGLHEQGLKDSTHQLLAIRKQPLKGSRARAAAAGAIQHRLLAGNLLSALPC